MRDRIHKNCNRKFTVLFALLLCFWSLIHAWWFQQNSYATLHPDRPWGPPSLLYNGYLVFPGGKERSGRDADPSPPSSAVGHERVKLNLYSPYGPYGLYRDSVPVQVCTLPSLPTLYLEFWAEKHLRLINSGRYKSVWVENNEKYEYINAFKIKINHSYF
jgi:hypothetical protein